MTLKVCMALKARAILKKNSNVTRISTITCTNSRAERGEPITIENFVTE